MRECVVAVCRGMQVCRYKAGVGVAGRCVSVGRGLTVTRRCRGIREMGGGGGGARIWGDLTY